MAILATYDLPLAEASEVRDSSGHRRYGSTDTLRRKLKNGSLPFELKGGKYYVSRVDLEALRDEQASERAFADLKAAAKRAAALAPPIGPERREQIISILRGAR